LDERKENPAMWAQLIKTRLKPGKEEGLERILQQLRASEQPGTGLVRSTAMRDQKDPSVVYYMVVFESEEKARAREQDPRRQEGLKEVQATMADTFEGPPEFVDLIVLAETTG
jgi:quinol monooxygenase YgiN